MLLWVAGTRSSGGPGEWYHDFAGTAFMYHASIAHRVRDAFNATFYWCSTEVSRPISVAVLCAVFPAESHTWLAHRLVTGAAVTTNTCLLGLILKDLGYFTVSGKGAPYISFPRGRVVPLLWAAFPLGIQVRQASCNTVPALAHCCRHYAVQA